MGLGFADKLQDMFCDGEEYRFAMVRNIVCKQWRVKAKGR